MTIYVQNKQLNSSCQEQYDKEANEEKITFGVILPQMIWG